MLDVQGLTLKFGGLTAVNNVSLHVPKGSIFSIIGPNGAGKTSLFNAVTGIYAPTSGTILFEGEEMIKKATASTVASIAGMGLLTGSMLFLSLHLQALWQQAITNNYVYLEPFSWRQALVSARDYITALPITQSFVPFLAGFAVGAGGALNVWQNGRRSPDIVAQYGVSRTFQNIRLFREMTVLENVLVGMHATLKSGVWQSVFRTPGFKKEQRRAEERGEELLSFVGLSGREEDFASGLPYGHQRRVEIARALASRPKLLLLDEPAAGMNPAETDDLMELIRKIRSSGVTVVLIEHHMKVVMGISDRIAVLDYGNKIAEGTPEEIAANPKVIEAYLGKESSH